MKYLITRIDVMTVSHLTSTISVRAVFTSTIILMIMQVEFS